MEIKPKFDTNTIKIAAPVHRANLPQKIVKDPTGVIANGIYKVIRWEKLRQFMVLIFSLLIMLISIITMVLFYTVYNLGWAAYIIPGVFLLATFYKSMTTLFEIRVFKKAVAKYKADLAIGVAHHPPFIVKLYRNLYIKQVFHNWATFFLLLHIGLFTLILWWLKDKSWWIFEFEDWIKAAFHDPYLMQWIFGVILIIIAFIHVIFAIQRKKRILDIDAYFGEHIIAASDIDILKKDRNKVCRRLFLAYVLVILVIPLLVKWIIKFIRRKK